MKINEIVNFDIFSKYKDNPKLVPLQIFQDDNNRAYELDFYYSKVHSGLKTLLPSLEDSINFIPSLISLKFSNKWNRLYIALIKTDYVVDDDFKKEKVTKGKLTSEKTETTNEKGLRNKSDNNTGTIKEDTNLSTTNNDTSKDSTYGFNSESLDGVSSDKTVGNSSKTITGTGDNNKTTTTQVNETVDNNNVDKNLKGNTVDIDDTTMTEKGRVNSTAQKLLSDEVKMRNLNNLIDIMCQDLDTLICLSIY